MNFSFMFRTVMRYGYEYELKLDNPKTYSEDMFEEIYDKETVEYIYKLFNEYKGLAIESNCLHEQMTNEIKEQRKIYKRKIEKIRKRYHNKRMNYANLIINIINKMKYKLLEDIPQVNLKYFYNNGDGINVQMIPGLTRYGNFYYYLSSIFRGMCYSKDLLENSYGIRDHVTDSIDIKNNESVYISQIPILVNEQIYELALCMEHAADYKNKKETGIII